MRGILENKEKLENLKKKLLQYPGATSNHVDSLVEAYWERVRKKEDLVNRNYTNAMAERYLDRNGFPRPPGWRSVFLYPDSNRPRDRYVCLAILIIAGFIFI